MTTLLTGGTIVRSLDPPRVDRSDLLVRDGHIADPASVAPGERLASLDCGGCLVVPGNVCAHTHAYSALARGMPYDLPSPRDFLQILQRIWWRLDRALDLPTIRASALVAASEALRSGTTTLVDHHASPNAIDGSLDVIAEAFEEAGLRSVLCYEVSDRDGKARAREGIEENARYLKRTADGRWPLSRGMVGAHASFTLSEETLADCAALAVSSGTGLHIHAAEDAVDQADAVARFGRRVIARLAEAEALGPSSLLAHAVHVDPEEASLIRRAGAMVAHNPRSNMNNGVGRTPLGWLADRVALGTDGIGADLFEESRVAYLRHREEDLEASPGLALAMLAKGSEVAARAFEDPLLGRLVVGAPADVAILDYDPPAPVGDAQLAGHWIFGLAAMRVRDVLVAGELVLRNRRLARVDEAEVAMEARRSAAALWQRMAGIDPHPFAPTRLLAEAGTS